MNLAFDKIETPEALEKLREFARTFNHEPPVSKWPLIAFRMGDRPWHGYMQVYGGPVLFPAWSTDPKRCSKRDIWDTWQVLVNEWLRPVHGGGFMAVSIPSNFSPKLLKHAGFDPIGMELYETLR